MPTPTRAVPDIYFAPGRYQPHDSAGLELLGHELTHVVQQAQGRVLAAAMAGHALPPRQPIRR